MIEPNHLFARLLLILGLKALGLVWFSPLPTTFGAVPKPEPATDITREGFEHLARQRFPEALQAFRGLANGDAGPAHARLGLALALLGAPPLTPGKIDQAGHFARVAERSRSGQNRISQSQTAQLDAQIDLRRSG